MVMTDERTTTTVTPNEHGVYRIGRQLFRDIPRFKGFVTEAGDPWTSDKDGPRFEVHDYVPVKCIVPPEDADDDEIEQRRRAAARSMTDFLHPVHGWLRAGTKREREAPENLGTGTVKYRRAMQPAPVVPETAMDDAPEMVGAGAPTETPTRRGPGRPRRLEN